MTLNVPKFVMLKLTLPCAVTPVKAIVHVVPEPDSVPFVTVPVPLVMVISPTVNPVTAVLNVRTMPVELVVSYVPPVCSAVKVTLVIDAVTVSVKFCVALGFVPLLAVIVKLCTPTAVVLVIVISPDVLLMLTPAGIVPDKL